MKKSLIFALILAPIFAACTSGYNADDYADGGDKAPYYNERTSTFMDANNEYGEIDSMRPRSDAEKDASHKRWNSSRMETRWQEYRGAMVLYWPMLQITK